MKRLREGRVSSAGEPMDENERYITMWAATIGRSLPGHWDR